MKPLALLIAALTLLTPLYATAESVCVAESYGCTCAYGDEAAPTTQTITLPDEPEDELIEACQEGCESYLSQGEVNAYLDCTDAAGDRQPVWANTLDESVEEETAAAAAAAAAERRDPVIPNLNVPIPGLSFEDSYTYDSSGNLQISFFALYVSAIYRFAIVAGAILAIVMLMIAGLQYILARGHVDAVKKAKERMANAVIGLVLLLAAYNIALLIDPATVSIEPITIAYIKNQMLNASITPDEPDEGEGYGTATASTSTTSTTTSTTSTGTGTVITGMTFASLRSPYKEIAQAARDYGTCDIAEKFGSPMGNGNLPNQQNHHWTDRKRQGDYKKINVADWAAPWGSPIYAPFSGKVTYELQSDKDTNACGNRINLKGNGGSIVICHVKDFLNGAGEYEDGATVSKGDIIGHVGGVMCKNADGSIPSVPDGWTTASTQKSGASGTSCGATAATDNARTGGDCTCQRPRAAGNTTGPHIHVTMYYGGTSILSCLEWL